MPIPIICMPTPVPPIPSSLLPTVPSLLFQTRSPLGPLSELARWAGCKGVDRSTARDHAGIIVCRVLRGHAQPKITRVDAPRSMDGVGFPERAERMPAGPVHGNGPAFRADRHMSDAS